MKHAYTIILMMIVAFASQSYSASAASPAASAAESAASVTAASDSALSDYGESLRLPAPLELTARDFVTKVYGVLDSTLSTRSEICRAAQGMHLAPSADSLVLWLETGDGYSVSYYGMTPDVTAMAQFEGDNVSDFGFFFLFPYQQGERDSANARQSEFCGALLQEMSDIGLVMGLDPLADALFDAVGSYGANFVEMSLIEETAGSSDTAPATSAGRFIVTLTVRPNAYKPSDNLAARE